MTIPILAAALGLVAKLLALNYKEKLEKVPLLTGARVNEEDVHNAWCVWMSIKDPNHESLVPFNQLDQKTKDMDTPFVEAIRKVSADMP